MTLRHPFLSVLSYICYISCWWQNGEFSKSYCMFSHSNGIRRGHSARTDLFQTGFKFIHFHSHLQYCIALHMNFNIISFYLFVLIAAEHMKIPYPGTLHSKVRTLQNIKKPNKSCLSRDSVTVESKTKEQKQAQGRWSSASSDSKKQQIKVSGLVGEAHSSKSRDSYRKVQTKTQLQGKENSEHERCSKHVFVVMSDSVTLPVKILTFGVC